MKRALTAWKWSLGVVARSYRTVVLLAALLALWVFTAYEWLDMPAESSVLLMILSIIWAIAQLLAAAVIVGGALAGAGETEASEDRRFPLRALWTLGRKKIMTTLVCCVASLALVWMCSSTFVWINAHSVEVASFLTFHSEKPISHELIENICFGIEWLVWIIVSGFLLNFLIVMLRAGWRTAGEQSAKMLAACTFRTPFLTSLLSVGVFGRLTYELTHRHPVVPPGFWDYTQVIVRFSLALFILSAGVLFWALSLARLHVLKQDPSQVK
jgi:hypothetical protein